MPRYKQIYTSQAEAYDRLVSREDWEGNLGREIRRILPGENLDVVELGAGTGRVTRLLSPQAKSIRAFDAFPAMIELAALRFQQEGLAHVSFARAENRSLPVPDACADLSLAGWTIGHSTSWLPDRWQEEVDTVVKEMKRVLRPGGRAIILETLGTGSRSPQESERGAIYYRRLEEKHGFQRSWIRTDYRFPSLEEANYLTENFFGKKFALEPGPEGSFLLPECTGVWLFPTGAPCGI
jgi:ubiquinone/menaquinone biosynthesis C-methylase UbiE